MRQTTVQTVFNIPAAPTANPFVIVSAWQAAAARIMVDNTGAVLIFLARAAESASKPEGPTSDSYEIPPGQSRVFVLAPNQKLFAAGAGAGGRMSISMSELTLEDLTTAGNGTV